MLYNLKTPGQRGIPMTFLRKHATFQAQRIRTPQNHQCTEYSPLCLSAQYGCSKLPLEGGSPKMHQHRPVPANSPVREKSQDNPQIR